MAAELGFSEGESAQDSPESTPSRLSVDEAAQAERRTMAADLGFSFSESESESGTPAPDSRSGSVFETPPAYVPAFATGQMRSGMSRAAAAALAAGGDSDDDEGGDTDDDAILAMLG